MAIRYDDMQATLEGRIGVEDAEALSAWLAQSAQRGVDLSGCTQVHAAVLQVLLARRPVLRAMPAEARLAAALDAAPGDPNDGALDKV